MHSIHIKTKALIVLLFTGLFFTACEDLLPALEDGLTEEEIVEGLKEALKIGTDTAVTRLSKENGYYGDPAVALGLPEEATLITENLAKLHLFGVDIGETLLEETRMLINRAAEDAATKAAPIFVNAITGMTVEDGTNILYGNDSAATNYLRSKTHRPLFDAFTPKIDSSLSKTIVGNLSAQSAYEDLINLYNSAAKISFGQLEVIEETNLAGYTTKRALNGLFKKVAGEEKDIREDASARVNDILQKVFSELDQ